MPENVSQLLSKSFSLNKTDLGFHILVTVGTDTSNFVTSRSNSR
jgi:hypothetical protein